MAEAAERRPEVAGNGPDVSTLAADQFELDRVGIGPPGHLEALDPERAGRKVHLLTGAGACIGALAIHLHGRELRRNLQDLAPERAERGARSGEHATRRPASATIV